MVADAAGLHALLAEVLEQIAVAALGGADVVQHGFEAFGGMLFEGAVIAFCQSEAFHIHPWGGEDDLGFGGLGFVVDDFQGVHVVKHVRHFLFGEVQPPGHGAFGDGDKVGEESAVHAQHERQEVGVAFVLRHLESVDVVA